MKLTVIKLTLAALASLSLMANAQTPVLLNINNSTSPSVSSVGNYQAEGVPGLTGSEPISEFAPAFNVALTSPMAFTSGGQVMYMDSTANGGTWTKATGAGSPNGLMDCYLYSTTTTPRTMTVSNLNLIPGTNYTLYLIGTIPVSGATEDGLFQPVNTPNITFASTVPGQGILAVAFTTSAAYSNTDTLQFTWARVSSGNGTFQGLAIVPGTPSQLQTLTMTNGVQKYASLTSTTMNMSGRCELWVTGSSTPLSGCTINLNSVDAWLFMPNVKPSAVVSTCLGQVRVNGALAMADSNVRVVQYGQNGAIIIPQSSTFQPLTVFTGNEFTGTSTSCSQYYYYTGAGITNISSFKLKRGYQAVLAQSADGKNYSKCYVAQDGDLEIGVLPATLDKQVQFIYVTPWRWTPKKGIASDPGIPLLNLCWWYNWNIDQNSTRDFEYVAIRQNQYWPDLGQNWRARGVNTLLGYNEPDRPDQANMSVGTAIDAWGDLLGTGLRVGSPATSDGGPSGWLFPFIQQADASGLRVDFVAQHYYQSHDPSDAAGCASQMYNFLLFIWNNTHRPIWVTEWNNGANWTDGTWPAPTFAQQQADIAAMVNMLETTPFVERYSLYNWVETTRQLTTNGVLTGAGVVYSNTVSAISYSQAMPDNGTRGIAQYLFNTNLNDTSGYYNNAMSVGAPAYITGHNAQVKALALEGANSYVQLPANIATGNAFTFAAWVYWNGGSQWQRIFDFGNDTSHYLFLTPNSGSTSLRFAINNGNGEQILERSGALASGSWQHVAVTLSNNVAVLFVNGAQVVSSTSFSISPSAFSPIKNYLGKSQFADPLFNGKFDEVEIADYAMTAAQISALYSTAQFSPYGGAWTNNASGNWGSANNWNYGAIATGASRIADFSTIDITANQTVTLDSARTIGGLRFGDTSGAQNWILSGISTLTLDGGGGNAPLISVAQNTATVSTSLSGSTGLSKTGGGALTLNGANTLGGGLSVNNGTLNVITHATTFGNNVSRVGYLYGSGKLALLTGGNVSLGGELQVGGSDASGSQYAATGTVVVSNATLSVGALTVARGNYLDNTMNGTVTVGSGGVLISTNDVLIEYAGTGRGKLALAGGNFIIGPAATKWLMVGCYDSGGGELAITNGNLFLENGSSIKLCRQGNTGSNVVNHVSGNVTFYSDAGATVGGGGNLDLNYAGGSTSANIYNLNGGTLTVPQLVASSVSGSGTFNFNGGTLKPTAGTTTFMQGLTAANVRNNGGTIDTAGFNVTVGQPLQHSIIGGDNFYDGGLRKNGGGMLTLNGTNTYRGNTTVNAGTLALGGTGSISNSRSIDAAGGATLDVSAVSGFTLGAAQSLTGGGTINGNVVNTGTLSPGTAGVVTGTLTFNSPPILNGTTLLKVSRSSGVLTSDKIRVSSGALTLGGLLTVASIGELLQAGDSFQLFSAASYGGAFAVTNLPALNPGLAWTNSLAANGTIAVISTVSLVPTNIVFSSDNINLTLSWPVDHTGWRLQSQTNALGTGLGTNWFDVANATATNQIVMPVDATQGSVFYRLVFP